MRVFRLISALVLLAATLAVVATPSSAAVTIITRSNGIVDINGDNDNNDVFICQEDGVIRVTTSAGTVPLPAGVKTIRINLRGGDDTLTMGSLVCGSNIELPLDLRIILGAGADEFLGQGVSVGRNVLVLGQGGEDSVILSQSSAARLTVNTSTGPSTVLLSQSSFGRVSVRGGTLVDEITVFDTQLGRNPNFFTNSGDDNVDITFPLATGRVTINTGNGDDFLNWVESEGCLEEICDQNRGRFSDYKLNVIMGGGADTTRTAVDLMPGDRLNGGGSFEDRLLFQSPGGATINAYEFFGPLFDNRPPEADDDFAEAEPGQTVTIDVLDGDFDPDGDPLTISAINTQPISVDQVIETNNGQVVLRSDNQLDFTPYSEYTGTEMFQYTINDGNGGEATATVSVVVSLPNIAPTASPDTQETEFETPVDISVLANDDDPDNGPQALSIIRIDGTDVVEGDMVTTAGGVATLLAGGIIRFVPNDELIGDTPFTYTITDGEDTATASVEVEINRPPNQLPTATDDEESTPFQTPVVINVVNNDVDPDNGPNILAVNQINGTEVTPGDNTEVPVTGGTATLFGNGASIRFTPSDGFSGEASFEYRITDGEAEATATVTIAVGERPQTPAVIGGDLSGNVTEDSVAVATGDATVTDPNPGEAAFVPNVGTATYGDHEVDAAGNWSYDLDDSNPTVNALGVGEVLNDSFTITTVDGTTETVNITINGANDAPTATNDEASTDEDQTLTIPSGDLLANDSDPDSATLTITDVTNGSLGTASVNGSGDVVYIPNADANGSDIVSYTVSDNDGGTSVADITITINPVNDPAVVGGDLSGSVTEDSGIDETGTATVTDPDPGEATFVPSVGTTTYGDHEVDAAGNWSYDLDDSNPTVNALGVGEVLIDSFIVITVDGTTEAVDITINGANDAPTANDDMVDNGGVIYGGTVTVLPLGNDTDPDGDTLSIIQIEGQAISAGGPAVEIGGGNVARLLADGVTVEVEVHGVEASELMFSYQISDGNGGTDTATITVVLISEEP